MASKHHPTPLSGGDRKALKKELGKARAMMMIPAAQSEAARIDVAGTAPMHCGTSPGTTRRMRSSSFRRLVRALKYR
jgi:hypothetical protein